MIPLVAFWDHQQMIFMWPIFPVFVLYFGWIVIGPPWYKRYLSIRQAIFALWIGSASDRLLRIREDKATQSVAYKSWNIENNCVDTCYCCSIRKRKEERGLEMKERRNRRPNVAISFSILQCQGDNLNFFHFDLEIPSLNPWKPFKLQ